MRDSLSNMQVVNLGTLSLSGTTPAASAWVDTLGYDSCTLVMVNGTVTVAGVSGFTATAQHSDSTAAASAAAITAAESVSGATGITVTADTADNVVAGGIGYNGTRRYVRFNVVGTTNTNAAVTIVAILSRAARAPVAFAGASVAAT